MLRKGPKWVTESLVSDTLLMRSTMVAMVSRFSILNLILLQKELISTSLSLIKTLREHSSRLTSSVKVRVKRISSLPNLSILPPRVTILYTETQMAGTSSSWPLTTSTTWLQRSKPTSPRLSLTKLKTKTKKVPLTIWAFNHLRSSCHPSLPLALRCVKLPSAKRILFSMLSKSKIAQRVHLSMKTREPSKEISKKVKHSPCSTISMPL